MRKRNGNNLNIKANKKTLFFYLVIRSMSKDICKCNVSLNKNKVNKIRVINYILRIRTISFTVNGCTTWQRNLPILAL